MKFLKLSLNILINIVMAVAFSSNCLVPHHYDLKFELESKYMLKGESNITVFIICTTRNITFHVSTFISVREVNMKSLHNLKIYTATYIQRLPNKITFFPFDNPDNNLENGLYILNIKFENMILERYTSKLLRTYWYEHKQEKWMMAILNQPRTARELFPCFDDPELIATFKISVEHDKGYRVLSNTPIEEYDIIANGTIILTHFQMTSGISPNDVAILIYKVNGLHPIHIFNWNKAVTETWCRPYFAPYVKLGLYVVTKITLHLENEWNILKDVLKVDYVAVPNFKNKIWRTSGLIIYNEADLAYDEKLHLPAHKFIMMRSIAHDIIYQRYGYIFDASYRWLNEGFILFFETYIVDQALPDSRMMDLFVVQAKYESQFLTTNVTMDTINFTKDSSDTFNIKSISSVSPIIGALIWRMLQSIIPDKVFWTSINTYLKLPNFNSKTPNDLWNVMENETLTYESYDLFYSRNVKEMMNIWLTQKYCPVLNVTRDYSTDQVTISQEFNDKLNKTPYFIPFTFTMDTNINFIVSWPYTNSYLKESEPTLEILLDKKVKWIIVNIQQTGYYRVNYDKENWQRLAHYLNSTNYSNIHVLNRAQIMDDAFYFATNRELDFYVFWELASYLWREKDYIAWYPMIKTFQYTSFIFAFSNNPDDFPEVLQKVLEYIRNLFLLIPGDTYDQMMPTNNDLEKSLKQELARIACIINNSLCIRAAESQLELYLNNAEKNMNTILPGWHKWTYCNGLKDANFTTWFSAWEEALRIYIERFDHKMLEGLICSEDPEIIIYYLSFHLANLKYKFQINKFKMIAKEIERKVNSLTANIFLSTLSRHAKNIHILKKLLKSYEIIKFSHVNINAVLSVAVHNAHSSEQLNEINNFTTTLHIPPLYLEYIARTIRMRNRKISDQLEYYRNLYDYPSLN